MKNEITGEMIETIVKSIGMREQVLRQLVLSASDDELRDLYNERKELLMHGSSTKTVRIEAEITQVVKCSIAIEIPRHVEDGNVFDFLYANRELWAEKMDEKMVHTVPDIDNEEYYYRVIGINGDIVYGGTL
jgi:hypothetical protein